MVAGGIGSTILGLKALNRNRQLLWFTLLAGLVLAGNAIGHASPHYLPQVWTMQSSNVVLPDYIVSYILNFLIAFATQVCLWILLMDLVLNIFSKKDRAISLFEGLTCVKKYLKAIFLRSVVLAFAGMLLDRITYDFLSGCCRNFGSLIFLGPLRLLG